MKYYAIKKDFIKKTCDTEIHDSIDEAEKSIESFIGIRIILATTINEFIEKSNTKIQFISDVTKQKKEINLNQRDYIEEIRSSYIEMANILDIVSTYRERKNDITYYGANFIAIYDKGIRTDTDDHRYLYRYTGLRLSCISALEAKKKIYDSASECKKALIMDEEEYKKLQDFINENQLIF